MSTILDALNKYKKEKEQREGQPANVPGGQYLDGDTGGGGSPPQSDGPQQPPAPGPHRRSMALIVALVAIMLVLVIGAGAYLFSLIDEQNRRLAETTRLAEQKQQVITLIITPVPTPTPAPTAEPTPTPAPTPAPTPPPPTPAPTPPHDQPGGPAQDGMPVTAATRQIDPSDIGYKIDGIMWDIRNPAAIINGKIVGVGDSLEGYKIVKINRDSIEVVKGVVLYRVLFRN